jgi:hypothetical protein
MRCPQAVLQQLQRKYSIDSTHMFFIMVAFVLYRACVDCACCDVQEALVATSKGKVDIRLLMTLLAGAILERSKAACSSVTLAELSEAARAKLSESGRSVDSITPQVPVGAAL